MSEHLVILKRRDIVRGERPVIITLEPELEAALEQAALRLGVAPESLVLDALRRRFLQGSTPPIPRDEWELRVSGMARECGVSLSDSALSRQALYE
jgi:hypothetical protein